MASKSPTITRLLRLAGRGLLATVAAATVGAAVLGCDRENMAEDSHYKPYEPAKFFPDGSLARPLMEGTIARGHLRTDEAFFRGTRNGVFVTDLPKPFELTDATLRRGQERYDIFCSVCHGYSGRGDGMIVQRGFKPPPSFHAPELRAAPPGRIFSAITNGFGAMYDYADRITPEDRWAIAAYVKTLQLSQDAPDGVLTDADRAKISQAPTTRNAQ